MIPPSRCRERLAAASLASALVLLAAAPGARADDRQNVLVMRMADLEAQGRCAEVVALRREQGADDPHSALIAGRCQVRDRDYAGALDTLGAVGDDADAPPGVALQRGIAHYHLGELDAARASIERARAQGAEGALLDLYSGLLQLQRDEARDAALSLERARRADARAVEPVASYYAFVAWRSLAEEARAKAALARLRESDPDGPWIAEAERILAGDRRRLETPHFWANVEAGVEYDTNVSVKGGIPSVFINGDVVDEDEDGRGVWSLDGGVELFREEHWSGGLMASYTGTAHFDIHEFDTHYPTLGAWLDHHFDDRTSLRARYDYGFAWVNYEPYVGAHTLSGTLFHVWDDAGLTELSVVGGFYDFRYDRLDPPGAFDVRDIDRDGTELSAEWLQRVPTGLEDLEVRGGYRYSWYTSDGQEYDYMAHRVLVGFDVTLPLEIGWDAWASFTYRPFDEASVYDDRTPPPRHRDRLWETGTSLEKFLTDDVSVLARYYFADSGANVDAYDYDRHVVGAYVRIRFP